MYRSAPTRPPSFWDDPELTEESQSRVVPSPPFLLSLGSAEDSENNEKALAEVAKLVAMGDLPRVAVSGDLPSRVLLADAATSERLANSFDQRCSESLLEDLAASSFGANDEVRVIFEDFVGTASELYGANESHVSNFLCVAGQERA